MKHRSYNQLTADIVKEFNNNRYPRMICYTIAEMVEALGYRPTAYGYVYVAMNNMCEKGILDRMMGTTTTRSPRR